MWKKWTFSKVRVGVRVRVRWKQTADNDIAWRFGFRLLQREQALHSSFPLKKAKTETSGNIVGEVKRIHETRRVRVRPTLLVKHSWRVEKRLSHWWRVADECHVKKKKKKMAHGRLPGSTSKLPWHATASPPSGSRGCMHRTAEFCLRSLGSLWFWFDDFPRKGSERARRRSSGRGRLPTAEQLLPLISTENVRAVAKSTLLAVERGKVLPRCPKSTLSKVWRCQKKKKSKFGGNLTQLGVRVRGLGLVWTSALTRSDQDQHQTRSRNRRRNLTRLVSHVLLTSPLSFVSFHLPKITCQDSLGLELGFSRCENLHFWWTRWYPKLGKWWKKCFWTKFGPKSVEKWTFFQKLAFQSVKISDFRRPDDVKNWESDEKSVLGQSWGALFLSAVAVREADLRTPTLKVTVFLHQPKTKKKNKKKTCSTTRKGPHAPRKFSFPKKKKKKTKLDDLDLAFLLRHIASAAACAFFLPCSASSAKSCPSGRFSLFHASRCSFKILLQYP